MTKCLLCVAAAVAITAAQAQTDYSETVLHNFTQYPWPKGTDTGSLTIDSSGNLYGPASAGGTWGQGVVYRLDPAGNQTVLHSFSGGSEGALPEGVLSHGADNLYGTAARGGTAGCGVVFKLDSVGRETVLHAFACAPDGDYPEAGVVLDAAGNLYGTTFQGGAHNAGAVFKLNIATGDEAVLYSFTGGPDGGYPQGALVFDPAGNLYGTASGGGATGKGCSKMLAGCGVVYKVDSSGHETVLYAFTGGYDGNQPEGALILDAQGSLYGAAGLGPGLGLIFKIDPAGSETVIHRFTGGADGTYPTGGLVRDSAGNIYGTTVSGGIRYGNGYIGYGVVFKLDPAGQETVLYSFTGTDGESPDGVISDATGNLYGTTAIGGSADLGAVFKLDTSGQETTLYSFPIGTDVMYPEAGVAFDAAGNLYGTTSAGGDLGINDCKDGATLTGCGAVYKLDTAGHETVLHMFTYGNDGAFPSAGVTLDAAGNIYGTAPVGGAGGEGIVFKLDAAGNETVYSFSGADGAQPSAGVALDPAGNLYGTTYSGGTDDDGVVYKLDANGNETALHSFQGIDGAYPTAGVVLDPAGNLYGTTSMGGPATGGYGVIYKIDLAGNFTVLYSLTGGTGGRNPGALARDASGNLYGTAEWGGACANGQGCGVVFKLDAAGNYAVLYMFAGPDGTNPLGAIALDAAGNIYGTTIGGGASGLGVVFQVDQQGNETVLHNFAGAPDGRKPMGGVIIDASGNLYGTTYEGGKQEGGVIFKLTPPQ